MAEEEACRIESPGQTPLVFASECPAESGYVPHLLKVRFHNLPAPLTSLIGREQEVAMACSLLRRPQVRLLTLTGTGGVGKTRLGLQIATDLLNDFADGICFVPLAPITNPELVVPAITQALGLRGVGDQPLFEYLKAYLRGKHLLLFLDNFEQVVPAAPVLTELLGSCPFLKLLVTSREVLRVDSERELPVLPLALPDLKHLPESEALSQYAAVALFVERVQSVKPDFHVTDANARTIATICTRLDGLPLALELAASRIRLLSPPALLARLEHRLQVLTQGRRDVPERQQTLRNTLQWSYDLLSFEEQRLFQRLAVFTGGCTLEAIEAVCAVLDDGSVLDGVASLIDKSLLQQMEQAGQEEQENRRLVMLETIREYGLEALAASGEMEATRQAHAAYYLALAEEAERELAGSQQALWLERLEREHDNLRAAMQWLLEQGGEHHMEMALRLGAALAGFWMIRGHYSEGRNVLERALPGSEGVAATVRAKALSAAATLVNIQGDTDRSEALAQESLALYRELGDPQGIADSLYLLGHVAWLRGNLDAAGSLLEEGLAVFREVGDKASVAYSLFNLAGLVGIQGEYARARTLFEESLALFRDLGNKRGVALVLLQLADMLFGSQGDQTMVRPQFEEGLALCREVGDKDCIASYFYFSGQVALSQGDVHAAYSQFEQSLALYREMGDRQRIARSLSGLAKAVAMQGDLATARALYEESLVLAGVGHKLNIASGLEGLADVIAAQGEPTWAARLWGAAEALRDIMGAPIPPVGRPAYEQAVTAARTQLGEDAFMAAWREGRSMTPEQALTAQKRATIPQQVATETRLPVEARPSPSYPAGLTAREVEVLRLLARGLTNTQIAEQLVLSPHTVHSHVRSILSKLGVPSRGAVIRFAFEHHLT